ncbi:hypothetical protein QE152_g9485 [Popillia japonica]|uniref:Uncharacterized protein n=1 Tax=Popillia japonica TaxID=7064 RepID=A0AAW1M0D5_POPJA
MQYNYKRISEQTTYCILGARRVFYKEKRLSRNPKLKEEYCQFLNEYEELGHMRKCDIDPLLDDPSSDTWENQRRQLHRQEYRSLNKNSARQQLLLLRLLVRSCFRPHDDLLEDTCAFASLHMRNDVGPPLYQTACYSSTDKLNDGCYYRSAGIAF